ncbi:MAG: hypothetical protein CMB76_06810 [Euryarchaeota archaeon]|nr:hypothetical protein [Euryarchaeota archaeon]|tara:strand:+ start:651 stop:893 length:243 start_codon:yes stop_codon:yes gene_type:complete
MRLAGDEEFYGQLSDDESTPDSKFDSFMRCYDILCSKGFSEQAATETAIAMVEGKEPMAQPSVRFAKINGDPSSDQNVSN